jgi:hypothetical protein
MVTALTILFVFVAALALFDLAAVAFGADSREWTGDDHRR